MSTRSSSVSSEADESLTLVKQRASSNKSQYVNNPVLCYLNGMYGKRPNELIQQVLLSFYSENELTSAKVQLLQDAEQYCDDLPASIKATHRPGQKKKLTDCKDLLAICGHVDGKTDLPIYVTSTIFRIPGEDPSNCDAKVYQSELKVMRSELNKLSDSMDKKLDKFMEDISRQMSAATSTVQSVQKSNMDDTDCGLEMLQRQNLLNLGCTGIQQLQDTQTPVSSVSSTLLLDVKDHGIVPFFGKESPFSNFFDANVKMYGKCFHTSEHAYQYSKATNLLLPELAEQIAEATTPRRAKELGDQAKIAGYMKDTWIEAAEDIMESVCLRKFEQNEKALDHLLKTQNRVLVEASKDKIWGCGFPLADPRVNDPTQWTGKNLLGTVLMRVRRKLAHHHAFIAEYRKEAPSTTTNVSKPSSYAGVLKHPGEWKLVHSLKQKKIRKTLGSNDESEGLVGVKKVRTSQMDFYVGQLEENTSEDQLVQYLKKKGVDTVKSFPLDTKIKNTAAYRIRCESADKDTVLDSSLWPTDVIVRPWIRKPKTA